MYTVVVVVVVVVVVLLHARKQRMHACMFYSFYLISDIMLCIFMMHDKDNT